MVIRSIYGLKLDNIIFGAGADFLFVPEIGGFDPLKPAPPGNFARSFLTVALNTGSFAAYNGNLPIPIAIKSIAGDFTTPTNNFNAGEYWIELPPSATLTGGARLTLIRLPDNGTLEIANGQIAITATGQIQDLATGEIADISYDLTAAGLFDDGSGTSTLGSFSSVAIVTTSSPENFSMFTLLALGSALLAKRVVKSRKEF